MAGNQEQEQNKRSTGQIEESKNAPKTAHLE